MQQRLIELNQRANLKMFVEEYQEELKQYGLEYDLGFFLHYEDLIDNDQQKELFYEITNNQSRQQVLFVTPKQGVEQLMNKLGHGCIRSTHWTIKQKADGSVSMKLLLDASVVLIVKHQTDDKHFIQYILITSNL